MYRISKCDLCPANSPDYALWLRNSPCLSPLNCMHILDVKFLLENWKHYRDRLALVSSDELEKKHAKKQLKSILWIFEQYGLSKEQLMDHFKYERDIHMLNRRKVNEKIYERLPV